MLKSEVPSLFKRLVLMGAPPRPLSNSSVLHLLAAPIMVMVAVLTIQGFFPQPMKSSARSGDGNIISQSNACNQNTLKSRRRLRNRHPGQEVPSWCSTNPNQIKSPSEQPTVPGQQQGAGTSNRELNEGSKIPVDVPTADSPTEESGYTGTTETRANLEVCPSDRFYPLCADDKAISAAPAVRDFYGIYHVYARSCLCLYVPPLNPPPPSPTFESLIIIRKTTIENLRIRLDNSFYGCAYPEILWCCFGFANVKVSSPFLHFHLAPPPTTPLTSPIVTRQCKASTTLPPATVPSTFPLTYKPFFLSRQKKIARF